MRGTKLPLQLMKFFGLQINPRAVLSLALCSCLFSSARVHALDVAGGQTNALPVRAGIPPKIDGDLSDFDLSGAEPVYLSAQLHSEWAINYDQDALYIGVRASLPNRSLYNPNNPVDPFWQGDLVHLRMSTDPDLSYPLNAGRDAASSRIVHLSLWKNSETGLDYLNINRGVNFDKGAETNPAGSQIVIKELSQSAYVVEARVPWSALGAPDGRNPFVPGQKAAILLETLWKGGDQSRVAAVYSRNPGSFGFASSDAWGQVTFAAQGFQERLRPSLQGLIAQAQGTGKSRSIGVPFTVEVPDDGLKVSVNILGPQGEVVRELMGGQEQPRGPLTLRWDGKDAFGHAMPLADYRWGAYFSRGLRAQYVGGVGKSGDPYFETADGRGGWGADHSDPIDAAADASGLYFLWPVGEGSRPVVKTDLSGRVLWRKNPFVGGGFGPFYAIASDGRFVYLTLGETKARLVRLDAATGQLLTWGEDGPTEMALNGDGPKAEDRATLPAGATPLDDAMQPEASGLAVRGGEVFVSLWSENLIRVVDAKTGKPKRDLPCPGPRGLSFDAQGQLFAVSFVPAAGAQKARSQVVRVGLAGEKIVPVVSKGLEAAWDVAVGAGGRLFVSDNGASQQIKVFGGDGRLLEARGKKGGRTWNGAYQGDEARSFLRPAGLAVDSSGALLVAESSIPRVFSRFDANGKLLRRWFGALQYWSATFPDPRDPRTVAYQLHGGLGRARVRGESENPPDAYWSLSGSGYTEMGDFGGLATPQWFVASNNQSYIFDDHDPHTLARVVGDSLRPVALARVYHPEKGDGQFGTLELWSDLNGDGKVQPAETTERTFKLNGEGVNFALQTQSGYIEPNGDLYLVTQNNAILRVPCAGWNANGSPRWELARADFAIPQVLPSKGNSWGHSWRHGILGVRRDQTGAFYVVFNTSVDGKGGAYDYATPALAAQMKEGMGHTATFNLVKFAKYDSQGRLLWMAGRKATGAAQAGEIYHFWQIAGVVEGEQGAAYVAGASEWGTIAFYTHDGFYVDSLMNDPGQNPSPGPYTFGGETNSGRVQQFADRDEVWAYAVGMAYQVQGFKNGRVEGESRASGTVALDKIYEAEAVTNSAQTQNQPLVVSPLAGDALNETAVWEQVPSQTLLRDGQEIARAQLGYGGDFLYGRFHVHDATPGENGADTLATAFKGGDTVGVVLGPDLGPNQTRSDAGAGDVRLMIARVRGQVRLVAMKALTAGAKKPENYFTPAAGTVAFEFVGEVPGGQARLVPDADGQGYTATFAVPRSFLEFDLTPGAKLRGDVELRLSGQGQRGLQAVERLYLFTPRTPATTMTDDLPTEARLYPSGWGRIEVR